MKLSLLLTSLSTLLLIGCTSIDDTKQLQIAILTDLYYLEGQYGVEEIDEFISNPEIVDFIKNEYPEVTEEILQDTYKLRKERTKQYDR